MFYLIILTAISCYHFVAPYTGSPTDPGPAFTEGYPLPNEDNSGPRVFYPGRPDLESSIAHLDSQMQKARLFQEDQRNVYQRSTYTDQCVIAKRIAESVSSSASMKETLERCKGMRHNGPIGRVIASSGIRIRNTGCNLAARRRQTSSDGIGSPTFVDSCPPHHEHHLCDFAVIRLSNSSRAVNLAPPQDLNPDNINRQIILHTAPPIEDRIVYKQGGATGATEGRVKDFRLVNRDSQFPNSSIIGNRSVSKTEIRFRAWRVISQDQSTPFSIPGDSAAGVNDDHLQLVGQIYSGFCDGLSVPISYMSAIDDVFDDVKEKLPGIQIKLSVPEVSITRNVIQRIYAILDQISSIPEPYANDNDPQTTMLWRILERARTIVYHVSHTPESLIGSNNI